MSALRLVQDVEQLAVLLGFSSYGVMARTVYLMDDAYKYRVYEVPKRGGGVRTISAPCRKLKAIQRTLKDFLDEEYRPTPPAHGFVPGRSAVTNAREHVGKMHVFNVDLKDFFGSIHFGRVKGLFMARPFLLSESVATVLAHICTFNQTLPQGAPTSPVLSNMIAWKMDGQLQRLAKVSNATYTRYADDLTFSFTRSRARLAKGIVSVVDGVAYPGPALLSVIASNGFEVNQSKVRLAGRSSRMEATGVTVNEFPNVPRRYVRQIGSMLHSWSKYGLAAAAGDFNSLYDRRHRPSGSPKALDGVVRGKLAYLRAVTGDGIIFNRLAARYNSAVDQGRFQFTIRPPAPDPFAPALWIIEACYDGADGETPIVLQGTGFAIGEHVMMTCRHCLYHGDNLHRQIVVYQAGRPLTRFRVSSLASDTRRDVAICRVIRSGGSAVALTPLALTDTVIVRGTRLTILGFPNHRVGMTDHYSNEVKVVRRYTDSAVRKFDINAQIGKGNSGGPLVDASGRVAGMALEAVTEGTGVNAALEWSEIGAFLNEAEQQDRSQ